MLAYIDPGSGSYVFQLLIGGILAVAATARLFWHRIVGLFHRRRPEEPEAPDTEGASGPNA
jgi:hypothetical protein